MAAKKDPDKEQVTEAEAGVGSPDQGEELRAGLATGSKAFDPELEDGHVIQASVEGLSADKPTHTDLSVVQTADGKKGPAA